MSLRVRVVPNPFTGNLQFIGTGTGENGNGNGNNDFDKILTANFQVLIDDNGNVLAKGF